MTIRRLALTLMLAAVPAVLLAQGRAFTFTGAALEENNISAVLVIGSRVLLADDELRAVLIGTETGGRHAFVAAPLPPPPGMPASKEEYDLEGLAFDGEFVFAIGSHAAVRTSADGAGRAQAANRRRQGEMGPRPDRDWLFRFRLEPNGLPGRADAVSLRPLLEAQPLLKPFLAIPSKENGIDIEGLAVDGDTLYLGFRGPVLRHGLAPVLQVSGFPALRQDALLFVALGGRGIRDLVKVPYGFLVLAGPVGDSDQDHRIYFWDGIDCVPGKDARACVIADLATVSGAGGGRAEGLAVLQEDTAGYEVLVVFDGIAGGDPRVVRVAKPAAPAGAPGSPDGVARRWPLHGRAIASPEHGLPDEKR